MSQSNVEVVAGIYAAFARGDLDAVLRAIDPEIEWLPPTQSPTAGTYRGHGAVLAELAAWTEPFDDYVWEPSELAESDDRVLVIGEQRGTGKTSGVRVRQQEYHVWTMRNGKAIRMEMFHDESEALARAGLQARERPPG